MATNNHPLPNELLGQLHEANEKFSKARHHLEEQLDSTEQDHAKPEAEARQELREAEKNVEKVTEQIDKTLHEPQDG